MYENFDHDGMFLRLAGHLSFQEVSIPYQRALGVAALFDIVQRQNNRPKLHSFPRLILLHTIQEKDNLLWSIVVLAYV